MRILTAEDPAFAGVRYLQLPAVGPSRGALADSLLTHAALEIGLKQPWPRIAWFVEAGDVDVEAWPWAWFDADDRLFGQFRHSQRDVIWILDGLDERDLAETIGHELEHVQQLRTHPLRPPDLDASDLIEQGARTAGQLAVSTWPYGGSR